MLPAGSSLITANQLTFQALIIAAQNKITSRQFPRVLTSIPSAPTNKNHKKRA
jgi:hypothetical protein